MSHPYTFTLKERAEVASYSSRAEITATHFENVYNYGDFRGDPTHFLDAFFDLHTYGLRLPKNSIDLGTIYRYASPHREKSNALGSFRDIGLTA